MGRVIGSVILGYIAMFMAVFVGMSAAWAALGPGGSFKPGSWDVSFVWVLVTVCVGFAAAVVGGLTSAAIAKDARGPKALAVVVVLLGLAFAIPVLTTAVNVAELGVRPETVPMMEAMTKAQSPKWLALLNPLLGAVGVMIGAGLRKGPSAPA